MCIRDRYSTPQLASALYWCCPLLSGFAYINQWTWACPRPAFFRPQNCLFMCGDEDPHLIHGSLGPHESTSEWQHGQFRHFSKARGCDRQTDRPCCFISSNRLHLTSAIMQPTHHPLASSLLHPPADPRGKTCCFLHAGPPNPSQYSSY